MAVRDVKVDSFEIADVQDSAWTAGRFDGLAQGRPNRVNRYGIGHEELVDERPASWFIRYDTETCTLWENVNRTKKSCVPAHAGQFRVPKIEQPAMKARLLEY
jgi:hypothetical protein